eukprot:560512-Alexandrium_andersonii.AAC.1
MSASLVGSEMCIRDSPQKAPQAPWRRRCLFWGGPRGDAPPAPERERKTCLLYTSDAADDM